MSIWKNGKLVAGGRQATPLLSFMWADHILDDISWLRADTFSWQSGAVYQAVYQHLADDIDGKTLQSETVGGVTVQFYLADDGHKICPASEESNVVAIYNATGVAWYYIIDIANKRFKLPRTQYGVTGLRDTVGNYVAAGLPNITGSWIPTGVANQGVSATGAFTTKTGPVTASWSHSGSTTTYGFDFDASASNSIYGNSTTVQPPATQMYLYFYVGEFTQTALENTAGLNAEDFNDKADTDFGNTLMIDYVVAKQEPNAGNGYTWYRKYKSGWVEQGGIVSGVTSSYVSKTLPVEMSDTNYTFICNTSESFSGNQYAVGNPTSVTTFQIKYTGSGTATCSWQVSGIAA